MPTLIEHLEELQRRLDAPAPPGELPGELPSSFGALRLPAPGMRAEPMLLAAAGIPEELIARIWATRDEPDFAERLVCASEGWHQRAPRLLRGLAWHLLRESPSRAAALVDAVLAHGRLEAPGILALLVDLAEEAPKTLAPHWSRLFERLVEGDLVDPLEGLHRLSDVFCLAAVPEAFVRDVVALRWSTVADRFTRGVLLRLCVFHRAVPLETRQGKLAERVHQPKTRYQAYSYHLYEGGHDWRVVDLTRELQQNPSELPKYAPSMYLRRYVGRVVEVEAFVDHAPDDPTLLVRAFRELETQPEPKPETQRRRPAAARARP